VILNDELEGMREEVAMAYVKGLLKHEAGQHRKNMKTRDRQCTHTCMRVSIHHTYPLPSSEKKNINPVCLNFPLVYSFIHLFTVLQNPQRRLPQI
jgi:hypothetical protein